MTREEAKSCICTIKMLQRLAYNIHGVMDVVDADNCKKIIKALEQEPCEDCISRQAVLNTLFYKSDNNCEVVLNKELQDRIKALPSVTPTTQWHRIKTRPLTEEEKDEMCLNDNYYTFMYDCEMPDDEQEVLIKTKWGIEKTTYHTDDGCYFEDYEDEDDVIAWTELPKWEECYEYY